jgi:four helix bundle protein
MDEWIIGYMDYSKLRNLNRGYMKLDVWQRGIDLFHMVFQLTSAVPDLKLRSQLRDAAQSVSANIAEGYCRRSLTEYVQFLYFAKGSLGETLTRAIGLWRASAISESDWKKFDALHYEVENKLLNLIRSVEAKRGTNEWQDAIPAPRSQSSKSIHPIIH